MKSEKYLPIGSICTIKNHQKKVMVLGFFSVEYNGSVKMYDYKGCDYPEGLLLSNKICSFNHEDIMNVDFMGYRDEFYQLFNSNLTKQQGEARLEKLETYPVLSNIQFDTNGVVVYDSNYSNSESPREEISVSPKVENVENPFVQIPKAINKMTSENSNEWSIFKNIQFDENGIVISAEEYTSKELDNKE